MHINIMLSIGSERRQPTFGENVLERALLLFGREGSLYGSEVQIE